MADKNHSNSLSKRECHDLLQHTFNVIMPRDVFERMFKVSVNSDWSSSSRSSSIQRADQSSEGVLNSEEFIQFFHLLTRRRDLYDLMKQYGHLLQSTDYLTVSPSRHARNGAKLPMDKIVMDREDLLNFLLNVQHVSWERSLRSSQQTSVLLRADEQDHSSRASAKCDRYIRDEHRTPTERSLESGW